MNPLRTRRSVKWFFLVGFGVPSDWLPLLPDGEGKIQRLGHPRSTRCAVCRDVERLHPVLVPVAAGPNFCLETAMKSRWRAVTVALALTGVVARSSQAQTDGMHFGPQVLFNFDSSNFGLGAQFSVPVAHYLEFYPSLNVFFPKVGSLWALNADLKYRFAGQGLNWLYAGTGLNLTHASVTVGSISASSSQGHLNLFGGVESLHGRVHPFGELRLILLKGSTVQAAAGLNITLGSHR